jgi:hypothetical protein
MVEHLPFSVPADAVAVAHEVVWAVMTTVDSRGRPRSRVVHPAWELVDDRVVGWVTSRPSPVKVAHLAANPHVACTYAGAGHDVAYFDCVATWVGAAERAHAWEVFRTLPPPAGFDPATIWPDGSDSPGSAALRLDPYRVQVGRAADLARGEGPRLWTSPS